MSEFRMFLIADTVVMRTGNGFGLFHTREEAQAAIAAVTPGLARLVRDYAYGQMVERYKPIVARLHDGLGEGWHVGLEEVGGGFTVIACRPVPTNPNAPYVWIDDQFGSRPQAGFYDGSDDDGQANMVELSGYDEGAEFGDNPDRDRFAIEGLLGVMRVLIEDFHSVWRDPAPKPEAPEQVDPARTITLYATVRTKATDQTVAEFIYDLVEGEPGMEIVGITLPSEEGGA